MHSANRWVVVGQGALLGLALLLGGCAAAPDSMGLAPVTSAAPTASRFTDPVAPAAADVLASQWGIRVQSLHLSAAGSMLDLRYRVLDAQKAAAFMDGKVQPYLLDAAHGAKLGVPDTPVLGRIRQTARNGNIMTDRSYFVMFGNPGKVLQPGNKVTLLLGTATVAELAVQ
jgi:hypothetical protein